MSTPPIVDYSATSSRPAWSELPTAVHRALAAALGAVSGQPLGAVKNAE